MAPPVQHGSHQATPHHHHAHPTRLPPRSLTGLRPSPTAHLHRRSGRAYIAALSTPQARRLPRANPARPRTSQQPTTRPSTHHPAPPLPQHRLTPPTRNPARRRTRHRLAHHRVETLPPTLRPAARTRDRTGHTRTHPALPSVPTPRAALRHPLRSRLVYVIGTQGHDEPRPSPHPSANLPPCA